MKRLVLSVGALVALFSFSVNETMMTTYYPIHRTEYSASSHHETGSTDGLVWPTNMYNCPKGRVVVNTDPPLPKNVPNATWYNTDIPPLRYRGNNKVTVYFESPEQINSQSNVDDHGRLECGSAVFAYTEGHNMHIPNPCSYPKTDAYARLVCHELGHINNWPDYHGD